MKLTKKIFILVFLFAIVCTQIRITIFKKKYNFIASILLLFSFLTVLVGCTKREYFKDSELKMVDVYSVGDRFLMASTSGDTLTFIIASRKLEKKKNNDGFGTMKYEELTYNFVIYSTSGNNYVGFFKISSLDFPNSMWYSFDSDSCLYAGIFDISTATNNITVNNINYTNANCEDDACYSSNIGFIKFNSRSDTLTLIP